MKVLPGSTRKGSPATVFHPGSATGPVRATVAARVQSLATAIVLAWLLMPANQAAAQSWIESTVPWIGFAGGTSGLGMEAGVRPADRLGVRLGLGWHLYEPRIDEDDVIGTVSLPSPITRLTVDLFPMGGTFHLSAGLHRYSGGLTARARARDSVEINDRSYTPEELGEASGRVWGRETSPYLGFGWMGRTGRARAFIDLGVAFTGAPLISVTVTGPIGSDPTFRSDLDAELRDQEDSISSYRFLPHLAAGLRFRLGP